ncbi:MAG: P-loop NTPase [Desulfobacteraceae bacterium]|nr:P-loop NTPase [Desulfobacteraceae bacterium]
MIISVASGKGGTGKTTVATNLAYSLKEKVQLLDCDVEAPNSHLFLNPEIEKKHLVNASVPKVDQAKCSLCKKCMDICRYGAIAVLGKTVMTFENLCHSCGGCFQVCPENAIVEKNRTLGTVESGHVNGISFIHGRLNIGQVMVPPIIREVRTFEKKNMVNIIDAPPGTSCPVIASVNHADVVLLVTEPTPFGLHDLKLAVKTVQALNVPHGLVINRVGIGDSAVEAFAKEHHLPVLMKIPFDKQIALVYSKGLLIAKELPEYKEKFIQLYKKTKELATKGN